MHDNRVYVTNARVVVPQVHVCSYDETPWAGIGRYACSRPERALQSITRYVAMTITCRVSVHFSTEIGTDVITHCIRYRK